jgi:hypothetical protein
MKNIIFKVLVGLVVVLATAGGVFVGGVLPELVLGSFVRGSDAGFAWLFFLPLLWTWTLLVGGLGAGFWRRCGFAPEIALPLSLVATLLVFGPSLLMLYGYTAWAITSGLAERIVALASLSFFPSQVAFWGFAIVMRIGWKRRRVGFREGSGL